MSTENKNNHILEPFGADKTNIPKAGDIIGGK